ncbi:hypothetical protein D3C80_1359870 [compost metagenome]
MLTKSTDWRRVSASRSISRNWSALGGAWVDLPSYSPCVGASLTSRFRPSTSDRRNTALPRVKVCGTDRPSPMPPLALNTLCEVLKKLS